MIAVGIVLATGLGQHTACGDSPRSP
jgi:hypothetical protein